MNAIVPVNMGQVASVFANTKPVADDLSAGVQGGYGLIGYKGKVFSIRYRGEEKILMRADGDGPVNSIELVILKASPAISKIFYKEGYVEGSTAAPDCYSSNGVTPDVGAQSKQSVTCAVCPHNQWGARITNEGKQAKACSDSRRVAVVPLQDIRNEVYGGPMLLRVPAASLQDLAQYGQKMAHLGYPYYAIATRVAFDPAAAYPKFHFTAIRALNEDEARAVVEMQNKPEVARVIADNEFNQAAQQPQQTALAAAFEQPPQQIAAPVQAQPAPVAPNPFANVAPAAPAAPVAPVVTQQVTPPAAPAPAANPFANAAPAAPAAPVQVQPVAAAPVAPADGADDFVAALDAKLGELLPPA